MAGVLSELVQAVPAESLVLKNKLYKLPPLLLRTIRQKSSSMVGMGVFGIVILMGMTRFRREANNMATDKQLGVLKEQLKDYKKKYLRKEFSKLKESDTRRLVDYFLSEILGYKELEEIKTEYRIKSDYADYVIQVKRKKHYVVEVKSIQIDLNDKHLKQSLHYAADEGIDWVLLMNGRQMQLYRVNFGKPITTTLICKLDLLNPDDFKKAPEEIWYLTKTAVMRGELETFWKRTMALDPKNLVKLLYSEEIVNRLRNDLKNQTGIYFQMDDVADSLYKIITRKVDFPKPKLKVKKKPLVKPHAVVEKLKI